jgi:tetratricopeptide (TPR) repeat protein
MAVRDGRYKFILAPRSELYDLQADPREQRDLSKERPARTAAFEEALRKMLSGMSSATAPTAPKLIDPETEARLRALGYVGSGSARYLDDEARADPKDRIQLYNLLKAAATDSAAGKLDAAIEKVQQALAEDPGIIEGHTALANLYLKAERGKDAVEAYKRALALDPEHLGATFSLALAYKQLGDFDAAQAGFERSKSLDPRSGKARWQLADIWMQRGQFPRAEQELTEALELTVDRPSFLLKLGECYIEMRRLDEAEARIRAALDEKPDLQVAHYDLGLIHEARNQPAEAMRAYETELARNPTSYSASFHLGKLLDRAGRPVDALARFRETVSSNPTFAPGHLYLAKALLDAGDLRGAEESARRGLDLKPAAEARPLGHYVLADVYNRLGRGDEANRQVALARRFESGADEGSRRPD